MAAPIAISQDESGAKQYYFSNSGRYFDTLEEALNAYNSPLRGRDAGQAAARAANPTQNFDWSQTQNPTITDKATGRVIQQGSNPSSMGFWDGPGQILTAWAGGALGGAAGEGASAVGEGAGAVAPWGAGEAVSGAYPGLEAGAAGAGAAAGATEFPGIPESVITPTTPATMPINFGSNAAAASTLPTSAQAIQRILAGNGTAADYASVIGAAAPAALGAYASSQQTGALKDLVNKYVGMGAPYRDKLAALYANPSSFLTSSEVTVPVQQGTNTLARALSMKEGNPIGSGHALQEMQDYASGQLFGRLGQEKDRLAGFGGLSAYNAAAPGAATAQIGSQANIWNAIGGGINDVMNPKPTLADYLRMVKGLA